MAVDGANHDYEIICNGIEQFIITVARGDLAVTIDRIICVG